MKQEELLTISGLTKNYSGTKKALEDVSLTIEEGRFVSVIGSSGAGKSTLLRCVNRLIDPSEGSVKFAGQEITTLGKHDLRQVRRRISMVFQHYNLVHRSTAIENVLQGRLGYKTSISGALGLYTEQEKEQAFLILEQLGLTEFAYRRCDQLSGGQKQRVGIARALIQDPLMILADEPIASLDPQSSRSIMEYLRWAVDDLGIACLVNLHQVDYAIEFSDRIIGLREGRIVFDGIPAQLDAEAIAAIYGTSYLKEHEPPIQGKHPDMRSGIEADARVTVGVA